MGFRSYIRQFLGAVLMLFRPSLPWGFASGSGSSFGNRRKMGICCWEWFDFWRRSLQQQQETGGKGSYIIFSIGFRRVAGAGAAAAGGNRRKK